MKTVYIATQEDINRIVLICQAGTQAHGDEFYEQILQTIDGLAKQQSGTIDELLAADEQAGAKK
jgi:hypothetical protein